MARPIRIEYPGAFYHVISRGNARARIYRSNRDKQKFLEIFSETTDRYHLICEAYCLMGNHYHFLIETPLGNLSSAMRFLNSKYAQWFNYKYDRVGHLFQGRHTSILVEKDAYVAELARYIVLNPVKAKLVEHPGQWRFSSYRATVALDREPDWLSIDNLLQRFGQNKTISMKQYEKFVLDALNKDIDFRPVQQIYLGSDGFIQSAQIRSNTKAYSFEVTRKSVLPPRQTIVTLVEGCRDRNSAMQKIYQSGHYTMYEIAQFFDLHYSTVSRAINKTNHAKCKV
jgi:putative transposase